jgi:hypothetical protein
MKIFVQIIGKSSFLCKLIKEIDHIDDDNNIIIYFSSYKSQK